MTSGSEARENLEPNNAGNLFTENWQPHPERTNQDLQEDILKSGVCLALDAAGRIALFDQKTHDQLEIINISRKDGTFSISLAYGKRYDRQTPHQWDVTIEYDETGKSDVYSLRLLGREFIRAGKKIAESSVSQKQLLLEELPPSIARAEEMMEAGLKIVQLGYRQQWTSSKWLGDLSTPVYDSYYAPLGDEKVGMALVGDIIVARLKMFDFEKALKARGINLPD